MEATKPKSCKNCSNCLRVYGRWIRMWKDNDYYCRSRGQMTDKHNFCENWRRKGKPAYDLSAKRFDEAEKDVAIIYEYLNNNL